MSIFTISDLHLSIGEDKPMDLFGPSWANYTELIEKNWKETVGPEDTVVIPGDISWAMSETEAVTDLKFVDALPGKKLLMKGNHEYWWNTMSKLNQVKKENGLDSLTFFHNKGFYDGENGVAIAGTRGWLSPDDQNYKEATDGPVFRREVIRLENSIKMALADSEEKGVTAPELVVFLHYPPFSRNGVRNPMNEIIEKYRVKVCYYGHLHGISAKMKQPEFMQTPCECVSADFLKFMPVKIK